MPRRIGVRAAAVAKSNGRCWYCGGEGNAIEHQTPTSQGGLTTAENCVIACQTCNSRKRTRTVDEFRIYLMVVHGRAPEPFFGERPAVVKRDWIIINTPLLDGPRESVRDRMAVFAAGMPAR